MNRKSLCVSKSCPCWKRHSSHAKEGYYLLSLVAADLGVLWFETHEEARLAMLEDISACIGPDCRVGCESWDESTDEFFLQDGEMRVVRGMDYDYDDWSAYAYISVTDKGLEGSFWKIIPSDDLQAGAV